MNHHLRLILSLVAAALLRPLLIAADTIPPTEVAQVEVGSDVRAAWNSLQAANVKIGELIVQNRLADVPAQTRIVKASVETILRGVRPDDESILKRLVSAGREIMKLADHLAEVAASGKRARADVVHANLHKYVDFVQKRLPPDGNPEDGSSPSP
jgi:hypothetical protein